MSGDADKREIAQDGAEAPACEATSKTIVRPKTDESTLGLPGSVERTFTGRSGSDLRSESDLPRLQPGEQLAGRFAVLQFIASGGMGAVYEATDLMLKTRVALKVIRGRIATDATAMERFRREVLLARRVSHPNVCRVYELYEATTRAGDAIHFLTMELLEGETLARWLARRGRVNTTEALPLVRQMCEGLAAAHAEGVIHRDFKSNNVMLVPRSRASTEATTEATRVVITDFGVARAMDATAEEGTEGRLTGDAGILGTPEYMAPEQVTGGAVTPATDIYALGVVLYEMVTATLPFAGDTPLASAARRLDEAPPRPELTVPGLDKRWAAAILRCLARQPDRRFKSAREIIPALSRVPPKRSRMLAASGAALALLLGAFALVRYGPSLRFKDPLRSAVPATPRPVVAILGFRNELPSPQPNWMPTAVSELLAHELAAAETSLRVIPGDRVAQVRRSLAVSEDAPDEKSRQRMQVLLAANVLVHGSLTPREPGSDDAGLRIRLLEATSGRELLTLEEDIGPGGARLPEAVVGIGARLRNALGVAMSAEQEAALSASRVRNLDAMQAYAQGVLSLRKFETMNARNFFEAALTADSGFLDAQRRIVETWESQGNTKKAREAAQRIRTRASGLTSRQAAELDARLLALGLDSRQGTEARMALFDATPDDVEMGLLAVEPEDVPPRTKLALVRRLRQLPAPVTTDLRLDLAEADALAGLGETERARELLTRTAEHAKELGARTELGRVLREEGDVLWIVEQRGEEALAPFLEAERLFEEVGEVDRAADANARRALLLTHLGPPARALAALDEVAGRYRRLGDRKNLQEVLLESVFELLSLGEANTAEQRVNEARAELEALGEPLTRLYFQARSMLAFEEADLPGVRDAARSLRREPSVDEASALQLDAWVLREQAHFHEARESLARAAMLEEQRGNRLDSALRAAEACRLDCDEGKPSSGLACFSDRAKQPGMGEGFHTASSLLQEAVCRYRANDLAGAERSGQIALSKAVRFQKFASRIASSVLLARITAARGGASKGISRLRALLAEVDSKRFRRLAFEVTLALGEVELGASRPEGRTRLLKLEQEASSREFLRIARLASEALDGNGAHATPPGR